MPAPDQLAVLRRLLAGRFPAVPCPTVSATGAPVARTLRTGLSAIDDLTGGLPLGAITEIVCAAPSCGSHLLLGQLLAATRDTRTRVALIDGGNSFDPASFDPDLLAHLVWVRGNTASPPPAGLTAATLLPAADLLARDANLGLVVLDLRRTSAAELRRTPATHWYRLQHAVETAGIPLVVQTPQASVPSARIRLILAASHSFAALARERPLLLAALAPLLQRHRLAAAV